MTEFPHETARSQDTEAGGTRFAWRRFRPRHVPPADIGSEVNQGACHGGNRPHRIRRTGGAIASLKGWSGPAERGITVHPISAFGSVTDTALLEELRDLAEDGTLSLHVAEVMPATLAPEAHRRLAAGGIRGRIVLDFEAPLTSPAGIADHALPFRPLAHRWPCVLVS
jgi:hypothetical protein